DWSVPLAWGGPVLARIAEIEAANPSQKEELKPLRYLFLHARGALLYRAGRFAEATAALRDPAAHHPLDREFANWLFLALAEHGLGHAAAAKAAAAKARAAPRPSTVWEQAVVELLTAELDATLPLAGK